MPEVLRNDTKLQEVLWNFIRFDPNRRLTLSQNPHFYNHLPTPSSAKWGELDTRATEENWHTHDTQPICVLTNNPGRVFLELGPNPRAYDNVWDMNDTFIFKGACFSFIFCPPFNTFSGVCGELEGESIVGAFIQRHPDPFSWCHIEPLSSQSGTMDPSNFGNPSVTTTSSTNSSTCVPVKKWHDALRQALCSPNISPHIKIRIVKCTQPVRGCVRSD